MPAAPLREDAAAAAAHEASSESLNPGAPLVGDAELDSEIRAQLSTMAADPERFAAFVEEHLASGLPRAAVDALRKDVLAQNWEALLPPAVLVPGKRWFLVGGGDGASHYDPGSGDGSVPPSISLKSNATPQTQTRAYWDAVAAHWRADLGDAGEGLEPGGARFEPPSGFTAAVAEEAFSERMGEYEGALGAAARDPASFAAFARGVFGSDVDPRKIEALRQQIVTAGATGDWTQIMPEPTDVDARMLTSPDGHQASGAYVAAKRQILLDRTLSGAERAQVYFKELGHHFDTLLESRGDARGDEGDRFERALATGELPAPDIGPSASEDDTHLIPAGEDGALVLAEYTDGEDDDDDDGGLGAGAAVGIGLGTGGVVGGIVAGATAAAWSRGSPAAHATAAAIVDEPIVPPPTTDVPGLRPGATLVPLTAFEAAVASGALSETYYKNQNRDTWPVVAGAAQRLSGILADGAANASDPAAAEHAAQLLDQLTYNALALDSGPGGAQAAADLVMQQLRDTGEAAFPMYARGHAMYGIAKIDPATQKASLTIYNSGLGLEGQHEKHPRLPNTFNTAYKIEDIPLSALDNAAFHAMFDQFKNPTSPNPNNHLAVVHDIYGWANSLGGRHVTGDPNVVWQRSQKGSDCTLEGMFSLLRDNLNQADYKNTKAGYLSEVATLVDAARDDLGGLRLTSADGATQMFFSSREAQSMIDNYQRRAATARASADGDPKPPPTAAPIEAFARRLADAPTSSIPRDPATGAPLAVPLGALDPTIAQGLEPIILSNDVEVRFTPGEGSGTGTYHVLASPRSPKAHQELQKAIRDGLLPPGDVVTDQAREFDRGIRDPSSGTQYITTETYGRVLNQPSTRLVQVLPVFAKPLQDLQLTGAEILATRNAQGGVDILIADGPAAKNAKNVANWLKNAGYRVGRVAIIDDAAFDAKLSGMPLDGGYYINRFSNAPGNVGPGIRPPAAPAQLVARPTVASAPRAAAVPPSASAPPPPTVQGPVPSRGRAAAGEPPLVTTTSLTEADGVLQPVSVVTLDVATDESSMDVQARLSMLDDAAAAAPQGSIIAAPEYFLSQGQGQDGNPGLKVYTQAEFEALTAEVVAISERHPGALITPGSIAHYDENGVLRNTTFAARDGARVPDVDTGALQYDKFDLEYERTHFPTDIDGNPLEWPDPVDTTPGAKGPVASLEVEHEGSRVRLQLCADNSVAEPTWRGGPPDMAVVMAHALGGLVPSTKPRGTTVLVDGAKGRTESRVAGSGEAGETPYVPPTGTHAWDSNSWGIDRGRPVTLAQLRQNMAGDLKAAHTALMNEPEYAEIFKNLSEYEIEFGDHSAFDVEKQKITVALSADGSAPDLGKLMSDFIYQGRLALEDNENFALTALSPESIKTPQALAEAMWEPQRNAAEKTAKILARRGLATALSVSETDLAAYANAFEALGAQAYPPEGAFDVSAAAYRDFDAGAGLKIRSLVSGGPDALAAAAKPVAPSRPTGAGPTTTDADVLAAAAEEDPPSPAHDAVAHPEGDPGFDANAEVRDAAARDQARAAALAAGETPGLGLPEGATVEVVERGHQLTYTDPATGATVVEVATVDAEGNAALVTASKPPEGDTVEVKRTSTAADGSIVQTSLAAKSGKSAEAIAREVALGADPEAAMTALAGEEGAYQQVTTRHTGPNGEILPPGEGDGTHVPGERLDVTTVHGIGEKRTTRHDVTEVLSGEAAAVELGALKAGEVDNSMASIDAARPVTRTTSEITQVVGGEQVSSKVDTFSQTAADGSLTTIQRTRQAGDAALWTRTGVFRGGRSSTTETRISGRPDYKETTRRWVDEEGRLNEVLDVEQDPRKAPDPTRAYQHTERTTTFGAYGEQSEIDEKAQYCRSADDLARGYITETQETQRSVAVTETPEGVTPKGKIFTERFDTSVSTIDGKAYRVSSETVRRATAEGVIVDSVSNSVSDGVHTYASRYSGDRVDGALTVDDEVIAPADLDGLSQEAKQYLNVAEGQSAKELQRTSSMYGEAAVTHLLSPAAAGVEDTSLVGRIGASIKSRGLDVALDRVGKGLTLLGAAMLPFAVFSLRDALRAGDDAAVAYASVGLALGVSGIVQGVSDVGLAVIAKSHPLEVASVLRDSASVQALLKSPSRLQAQIQAATVRGLTSNAVKAASVLRSVGVATAAAGAVLSVAAAGFEINNLIRSIGAGDTAGIISASVGVAGNLASAALGVAATIAAISAEAGPPGWVLGAAALAVAGITIAVQAVIGWLFGRKGTPISGPDPLDGTSAQTREEVARHAQVLLDNFDAIGVDGTIDKKDLEREMNNPERSEEAREACRFFFENETYRNWLDAANGGTANLRYTDGDYDGEISSSDISRFLHHVSRTSEEEALLPPPSLEARKAMGAQIYAFFDTLDYFEKTGGADSENDTVSLAEFELVASGRYDDQLRASADAAGQGPLTDEEVRRLKQACGYFAAHPLEFSVLDTAADEDPGQDGGDYKISDEDIWAFVTESGIVDPETGAVAPGYGRGDSKLLPTFMELAEAKLDGSASITGADGDPSLWRPDRYGWPSPALEREYYRTVLEKFGELEALGSDGSGDGSGDGDIGREDLYWAREKYLQEKNYRAYYAVEFLLDTWDRAKTNSDGGGYLSFGEIAALAGALGPQGEDDVGGELLVPPSIDRRRQMAATLLAYDDTDDVEVGNVYDLEALAYGYDRRTSAAVSPAVQQAALYFLENQSELRALQLDDEHRLDHDHLEHLAASTGAIAEPVTVSEEESANAAYGPSDGSYTQDQDVRYARWLLDNLGALDQTGFAGNGGEGAGDGLVGLDDLASYREAALARGDAFAYYAADWAVNRFSSISRGAPYIDAPVAEQFLASMTSADA